MTLHQEDKGCFVFQRWTNVLRDLVFITLTDRLERLPHSGVDSFVYKLQTAEGMRNL